MSVVRLPAGHGQGTVAPRTRTNSGSDGRPADAKSGAPAPLLTFQAAAEPVSRTLVIRLPGRLVRIEPDELERFIEACR